MAIDILQMAVVLALLVLLAVPVGRYMAAVFTGGRTWLDPVFDRIDNAIYRLSGIRKEPQRWPAYVRAMLLTNLVMFLMILAILELQHLLPLNPDGMGFVNPLLAFNTAASFITNTNWQNYGGESTLSYFSQMFAIIFPMFTSAATGLACGVAFIRGLGGSVDLGNFYVDLTRSITRILLPAALIIGVVLVGLGVPATFSGAETVNTLNGPLAAAPASTDNAPPPASAGNTSVSASADNASPPADTSSTPEAPPSATSQGQQTITRGPVAALETIKELGTNGGGFFNANSAHPFENPRPITNVMQILMMATIPVAIIFMLGIMLQRKKQALVFFGVMAVLLLAFLALCYAGEKHGNPLLTAQGLNSAQGNMEGKEQRFGQAQTSLYATATTAFTTGTVDASHDSMTPLGSITTFSQMFLQAVFGGKGVGFITFIVFVILTIFLTGLMVGRTPEFLGKKIEAHEVKLAAFTFLVHPLLILVPTAITFALKLDLGSILNPGPHGFSEVLYAYTSTAANNGSAFAGLTGNTPWFNASLGVVMLVARYVPIVLMLALAGSLAAKKTVAATVGTMRTDSLLFAGILTGTILVIVLLTFFPVLAIGPIAEHFAMEAGRTF
jgi:potassium-transporting ATPase potassium-binding subunit